MKDAQWTQQKITLALVRIVMGWILVTAAAGKLWGWFGGPGPEATRQFYNGIGVPFAPYHAIVIGWAELVSGTLLILGAWTRIAAVIALVRMGGALYMLGVISGGIHQLHLMGFLLCLILFEFGGGPFSVDSFLMKKYGKQ
jgi:putative oxidoreductase